MTIFQTATPKGNYTALTEDNPWVGHPCCICGHPVLVGDLPTMIDPEPVSDEDIAKAALGQDCQVTCDLAHERCAWPDDAPPKVIAWEPGAPKVIDPTDEHYDRLLTEARVGCWCEKTRKPCPDHMMYADGLEAGLRAAAAELKRERRWKAEALIVMAQWDKVHEALGSPGALGQSIAEASLAEVQNRMDDEDHVGVREAFTQHNHHTRDLRPTTCPKCALQAARHRADLAE